MLLQLQLLGRWVEHVLQRRRPPAGPTVLMGRVLLLLLLMMALLLVLRGRLQHQLQRRVLQQPHR